MRSFSLSQRVIESLKEFPELFTFIKEDFKAEKRKIQLIKLKIEFKNYERQIFEFSKDSNHIVGRNASGKTTIFTMIKWLFFGIEKVDFSYKKHLFKSELKEVELDFKINEKFFNLTWDEKLPSDIRTLNILKSDEITGNSQKVNLNEFHKILIKYLNCSDIQNISNFFSLFEPLMFYNAEKGNFLEWFDLDYILKVECIPIKSLISKIKPLIFNNQQIANLKDIYGIDEKIIIEIQKRNEKLKKLRNILIQERRTITKIFEEDLLFNFKELISKSGKKFSREKYQNFSSFKQTFKRYGTLSSGDKHFLEILFQIALNNTLKIDYPMIIDGIYGRLSFESSLKLSKIIHNQIISTNLQFIGLCNPSSIGLESEYSMDFNIIHLNNLFTPKGQRKNLLDILLDYLSDKNFTLESDKKLVIGSQTFVPDFYLSDNVTNIIIEVKESRKNEEFSLTRISQSIEKSQINYGILLFLKDKYAIFLKKTISDGKTKIEITNRFLYDTMTENQIITLVNSFIKGG